MKQITAQEMIQKIRDNVKGVTFVSIDTVTDPRMKKTNNPFLGAMKHQTLTGAIGYDYEKGVNRLAEKEGKFDGRQAKERAWGFVTDDMFFVCKDKHENEGGTIGYLRMRVTACSNQRFILNGQEIEKEKLEFFLPAVKKSSTQSDLNGEVIARDIAFDSIKVIRMLGDEFLLIQSTTGIEGETMKSEKATVEV